MFRTRIENFALICMVLLCIFMLSGCSTIQIEHEPKVLTLSETTTIAKIDRAPIEKVSVFIEPIKVAKLPKSTPYVNPKDVECIASTLYHEARGEGRKGMLAVAYVIINRTLDERFPNTACGVVREGKYVRGKPVKGQCQFSWVCDGKPEKIRDKLKYEEAQELARLVLLRQEKNPVGKSLFFHATYVKPNWKRYRVTYKVGRHIFYA